MRSTFRIGLVASLVIASALLPLAAQIRDYVPIVKSVYSAGTIAFLEKLSESMKSDGYTGAAAILKAYATGSSSGSGFVFVGKDGANYVVTNRHVVAQADSITLEFEKPDGSQTVFKNCTVLAVGEDIDLALVALPATARPFTAGIDFAPATPDDGTEVWTAGYPGLGDTPSWQLGKGNVTNAVTKIPALVDPAISTLIQHSAQVDPGNSGGPLLVADKSSKAGYLVVGVNTWKYVDRQATNFSIPSAAVKAFVTASIARGSSAGPQGALLETRCRSFISASAKAEDAYKELAKYVSYAYVERDGEAIIKKVLAVAPTGVRSDIIDVFANVSPIEGIRLAIGYKIATAIKSDPAQSTLGFVAVDGNADAEGASVPVRFTLAGKELSLTWLREHGVWRLSGYPLDAVKAGDSGKAKKSAATSAATFDDSPYTFLLSFGPDLALGSSNGTFWRMGTYYVPFAFVGLGADMAWQTSSSTDPYSSSLNMRLQIEASLRAQVPIRFDNFAVIPYLSGNYGAEIATGGYSSADQSGSFASIEGGAQCGFGAEPHFFLGAAVKYYVLSPTATSEGAAASLWLALGF